MSTNVTELSYSKSEQLIKTYRYFSSTTNDKESGEIERSLTVTTKRIVLESTSKHGFNRDEFPIDFIERIDSRFFKSKKGLLGLIFLLIGIIIWIGFFIFGRSFESLIKYSTLGLGIFFFIFGLIYLIVKKSKQSFKLTFSSSKQFYNFSSISGENYIIKERKAKKESKVKVVSKVTPAALVMLNELNALLIDLKDFNFQIDYAKQMVLRKNLSPEEYEHHYHYLLNRIITLYK